MAEGNGIKISSEAKIQGASQRGYPFPLSLCLSLSLMASGPAKQSKAAQSLEGAPAMLGLETEVLPNKNRPKRFIFNLISNLIDPSGSYLASYGILISIFSTLARL
jgi:hypothetical protein